MRSGGSPTAPMFHLQAYRSWLVSRCLKMWPSESWTCSDEKFQMLVSLWSSGESFSLEELMDVERWSGVMKPFFGIGDILDHVIRSGNFDETPQVIKPAEVNPTVADSVPGSPASMVCQDKVAQVLPVTGSLTQDILRHVTSSSVPIPVAPEVLSGVHSSVGVQNSVLSTESAVGLALPVLPETGSVPTHALLLQPDALPSRVTTEVASLLSGGTAPMELDDETPFPSPIMQMFQDMGFSWPVHVPEEFHDTHCMLIPMNGQVSPVLCAVSANAKASDLAVAQMTLLSQDHHECVLTNMAQDVIPGNTRLVPGMVLLLWFSGESRLLPRMPSFSGETDQAMGGGLAEFVAPLPATSCCSPGVGSSSILPQECVPVSFGRDVSEPYVPSPTAPWTAGVPTEATRCVSAFPLLQLLPDQFSRLQAPHVSSEDQWFSILTQQFTAADRLKVLVSQGHGIGDDELRFHLQAIVQQQAAQHVSQNAVLVDPLLATIWSVRPSDHVLQWGSAVRTVFKNGSPIVTAVCVSGHWTPFHMVQVGNELQVYSWDVLSDQHTGFHTLFAMLAKALDCQSYRLSVQPRTFSDAQFCGALAIAFVSYSLLHTPLPETLEAAKQAHVQLRNCFVHQIESCRFVTKPWVWGHGASNGDLSASLAKILEEHGVPSEHSSSRAKAAIHALSSDSVAIALKHHNPWKQLKVLGNNCKFQFLLPTELQALIDRNRNKPVGVKTKKPKQKRSSDHVVPSIDPSKLQLLDGYFRANGKILPQLTVSQIAPTASGVVLATCLEAEPYIRASKSVSTEPLALLVFGDSTSLQSMLPHEAVTTPCYCALNSEPVLVDAMMYQIGSGKVERHTDVAALQMDTIDVSTVKLVIFRDECSVEWEVMAHAPIRFLVEQLPILRLCTSP